MQIASFVQTLESLLIDTNLYDVLESFHRNKERSFIPVINSFGEPLGIVREQTLRDFTFTMYGRELLKYRHVSEFLTPCPVVSIDSEFEELITTPTFQQRQEGFIVVDKGKYAGFLPTSILLQMYEEHRLQTMQQLLQAQKMESIGNLAGGLAHDFNNILGSITGYVGLIKQNLRVQNAEKLDKYLLNVETLAFRAADITQQLLGFARGGKYQVRPLNINEVVRHVFSIIQPTFGRSIVFEEHLGPDVGVIEADPGQLEQVLMNLCINARDAMPNGGLLSITTRSLDSASRVDSDWLGSFPKGGLVIDVRDTGTGIPPDILKRMFEPFFTTKDRSKGSGMGLAMVDGIVHNHGGQIKVQSEVGKGSTFSLCFPVIDFRQTIPSQASDRAEAKKPSTACVMIVDDDTFLLPMLSDYLKDKGYIVFAFNDGNEAIKCFREKHSTIDLILLDMIMPNISGQQVYHELSRIRPGPNVVFMSGYNNAETMQELLAYENTRFLQKPFSLSKLSQTISGILKP